MYSQRAALERLNYYNDSRVINAMVSSSWEVVSVGAREVTVRFADFMVENLIDCEVLPEDSSGVLTVACQWEICSQCTGSGRTVNPSIDAGGITEDDWYDWDEEEIDAYFAGRHDIDCSLCNGTGKRSMPVFPEEIQDELDAWEAEEYRDARERAAELAYGC